MYRQAPEHRFPAALDDCVAVVDWLAARVSGRRRGERPKLVLVGESCGGTLAAATSRLRSEEVRLQVVMSAPLDMTEPPDRHAQARGLDLHRDHRWWRWIREQYLAHPDLAADPQVSPVLDPDLRGIPPTLLVIPGRDPFAEQMRAYGRRLRAAGVEVAELEYPELPHAFLSTGFPFVESSETLDRLVETCQDGLATLARRAAPDGLVPTLLTISLSEEG
jgi:acetyl esterase